MKYLVLLVALTTSCSIFVPEEWSGVQLVCRTDQCPKQSEVVMAVELYAEKTGKLFAREPLVVHWYDVETKPFSVGAYTENKHTVHVTNFHYLHHELQHVEHWRNCKDPDHNHEKPPGPWTAEDNEEVRRLELEFDEFLALLYTCFDLAAEVME
jgi:hypothetical protein